MCFPRVCNLRCAGPDTPAQRLPLALQASWLYGIQIAGLLLVCALQFLNSMILGSLLISFNLSVLTARRLQVGWFLSLKCTCFSIVWFVGPCFHATYKGKCMTKFTLKSAKGSIYFFWSAWHNICFQALGRAIPLFWNLLFLGELES